MSTLVAPAPTATPAPASVTPPPSDDKPIKQVPSIEHNSPEEIEKRVKGAIDYFSKGRQRVKDEPKAKEEKPDEPKPKEPVEAKTEDKPKADPKPKQKDDDDAIAERIEKGFEKVAKRLEKKVEPKEQEQDREETKPAKTSEFTPKDETKLKVFEEMAKINEDYADLPVRFKKFVKAEKEYIAAWQKKNPDEKFDASDDTHAEFYEENEPTFDNDDYIDTRAELKARESYEKLSRSENEKREKAERENRVKQSAEEASKNTADILAKKITGKDDATFKGIEADDEITAKYIKRAEKDLSAVVAEVYKVFSPDSTSRFDPDGNPIHGILQDRLVAYEEHFASMDPEATTKVENGRAKAFATLEQFSKMKPADRAKHWTPWLDPALVVDLLSSDMARIVKADIDEDAPAWQKRISKTSGQQGNKAPTGDSPKPAANRVVTTGPTVTGGDRTVPPVDPNVPKTDDPYDRVAKWFTSR
jgi:hypothetical protein